MSINRELCCILKSELLQKLLCTDVLKIKEVCCIMFLLIKNDIDFDIEYFSETNRIPENIRIEIKIDRETSIVRTILLDCN